jgi:hypothetical protein
MGYVCKCKQKILNSSQLILSLTLGKLIGLEVQSQDLNARNLKREEKYREIQTAIVHYVRQNCSCHKTVLVTTLPNTNE